jgi:AcrR family transcriptional regulator
MKTTKPEPRRTYRMRARAQTAEATRQEILDAALECWMERFYDEVSLQEIARRAGVALQTVIRRFGSKDALLAAVVEPLSRRIEAERYAVVPGDLAGVVEVLAAQYEELGDATVRMQALEARIPAVAEALRGARAAHRRWLEHTFAEWLRDVGAPDYDGRIALLAVAVDVNSWKVLRREQGLSREDTARAMYEMLRRLAGATPLTP